MRTSGKIKKILSLLNKYLIFFMLIAFVITCCMMLFITILENSADIALTEENMGAAAKITLLNTFFLSLIFTILDTVRKKITVEIPVRRIVSGAEKIIQGDFSVRIKPQNRLLTDDSFNQIIACFNKMAEELGGVEALRTDFIADVSHEMKTPLSVIQNYGRLLQTENLSEDKRLEYAKGIAENSKRLAEMVTNILKLNRLENQKIYPNLSEFDLGEQLCECILQYENVWENSNIEIKTQIEENVRIKADSELLSHVWNNLLSNAFKFTEKGGAVGISLSANDRYAEVKISDTGCGMSSRVGEHIFEKFYQGDTSHSADGNGLGLALVKRVIDIMQGEISVESKVGEGSVFTVRIRR